MMRRFLRDIGSSDRGVTVVEFAIVAPVFLTLLMGGMDFGHTEYMQVVLHGTVQKAARDLTLANGQEAAQQTIIDTRVRTAVRNLNSSLADEDIAISRSSYQNFSQAQAKQPEDANGDGVCALGEVWIDRNFNNVYDADGGSNGQGGAKDVVVYSVTVSYPRLFPVAALIGMPSTVRLNATSVLANQPYGDQATRTGSLAPRSCT